jgi:hypothetical protein
MNGFFHSFPFNKGGDLVGVLDYASGGMTDLDSQVCKVPGH